MSTLGDEPSAIAHPLNLWANDRPPNWISSLPNELLMETFKLTIYEPHDSKSLAPEFPTQYTLTAVCRKWRYFVLDAKGLWTTIYLGPHASELFYNFFDKSKNAHLDIIVLLDFSSDAVSDAMVDKIASTLVLHSARTRSLRINLFQHQDLVENFFQQWIRTSKPLLSYLEISSRGTYLPAPFLDLTEDIPPPLAFNCLKTLVVRNVQLDTLPPIKGLTTLDWRTERPTSITVSKMVKHFPSVTRLVVRQLKLEPDDNPSEEHIAAVNIKELVLHLEGDNAGDDICRMEFPNLKYLEFLGHRGTRKILKHICTSRPPHLKKIRLCMMTDFLQFPDFVSSLQELESSIELEVAETYFTYMTVDVHTALFNLPTISSLTIVGIRTPIMVESIDAMFEKMGLSTLPFPVHLQARRGEWLSDRKARRQLRKKFGNLLTFQFPDATEGVLGHQYCSSVYTRATTVPANYDDSDSDDHDEDDDDADSQSGDTADTDTDSSSESSVATSDLTDEEALYEELNRRNEMIAAEAGSSDEESEN